MCAKHPPQRNITVTQSLYIYENTAGISVFEKVHCVFPYMASHDITWHHSTHSLQLWAVLCVTWHHMTSFYTVPTVVSCIVSHDITWSFYTVPTVELYHVSHDITWHHSTLSYSCELYRVSHDITWHHSALSLQLWAVSCVTHAHTRYVLVPKMAYLRVLF